MPIVPQVLYQPEFVKYRKTKRNGETFSFLYSLSLWHSVSLPLSFDRKLQALSNDLITFSKTPFYSDEQAKESTSTFAFQMST